MKKVFLIYSADAWISSASKELIAVCERKDIAFSLLRPIIKKAAKLEYADQSYEAASDMFEDEFEMLDRINQTQGFSTNYVIEEIQLNTIL